MIEEVAMIAMGIGSGVDIDKILTASQVLLDNRGSIVLFSCVSFYHRLRRRAALYYCSRVEQQEKKPK